MEPDNILDEIEEAMAYIPPVSMEPGTWPAVLIRIRHFQIIRRHVQVTSTNTTFQLVIFMTIAETLEGILRSHREVRRLGDQMPPTLQTGRRISTATSPPCSSMRRPMSYLPEYLMD